MIFVAERHIHCRLCVPEKDWHIPANWTADYAMAWFYSEHLNTHLADVVLGLTELLRSSAPVCRRCRRPAEHRPCFEVGCSCACSGPAATTTSEETARADG